MYNVISFCLYGSHATYILGMKENISLGKKFYPDWQIRIYYNDTVPDKYIKEYEQEGAVCIKCENIGKNKMNWEGMVWRFFPFDDENVDFWISRDADSRLSKREADIVKEWTESDKTLHCIRDHRCHYNPIMGGMFGIRNKQFHKMYNFKKISEHIKDIYAVYGERPYNVDQLFLNSKLWSLLKNDVMSHISNNGRRICKSDIEIPSAQEFIGKQYKLNYIMDARAVARMAVEDARAVTVAVEEHSGEVLERPGVKGLAVGRAWYGGMKVKAWDLARGADVTEAVVALMSAGTPVRACNRLLGGDPLPGSRKVLLVDFVPALACAPAAAVPKAAFGAE